LRILQPAPNTAFGISSVPEWPTIEFRTDASGPHRWDWTITWRNFTKTGSAATPDNRWDARSDVTNSGGLLNVRVSAERAIATVAVVIGGTNPSPAEISAYLTLKPTSRGMDRIIQHESKCRQFDKRGEPLRSFDNGYGLCQVTNPAPSIEQVWNWKLSVDLGLVVLAQKRADAVRHLSQGKRTYTESQLNYETVSRWNGGAYHRWDDAQGVWVRRPDVLCDTSTGNIGWDMDKPDNTGKTLEQLRARDRGSYGAGRRGGANWEYFGVCYADHLLG